MPPENDELEASGERAGVLQSPIVQFALFVLLFAVLFVGGLRLFG